MRALGAKNKVFRSYIGLGFSGTILPPPIQRNIFREPRMVHGLYTVPSGDLARPLGSAAELPDHVSDLTGLPIANASLLDEATAIAEAMHMLYAARPKELANAHKFFADKNLYPQNIDVLARAASRSVWNWWSVMRRTSIHGRLLRSSAAISRHADGSVNDYRAHREQGEGRWCSHRCLCRSACRSCSFRPSGEWGADVCVGNSQRFGVPMGYGGPHAAFFCTTEDYKRS
jgi:glycine dehydrogenase